MKKANNDILIHYGDKDNIRFKLEMHQPEDLDEFEITNVTSKRIDFRYYDNLFHIEQIDICQGAVYEIELFLDNDTEGNEINKRLNYNNEFSLIDLVNRCGSCKEKDVDLKDETRNCCWIDDCEDLWTGLELDKRRFVKRLALVDFVQTKAWLDEIDVAIYQLEENHMCEKIELLRSVRNDISAKIEKLEYEKEENFYRIF